MTTISLSAAVVDDDPLQVEILKGVAEAAGIERGIHFKAFRKLDALLRGAGRARFDIVFLDRRLPDCEGFNSALATLSQAKLVSPLVLMSAHSGKDPINSYGLKTFGPMDKLELVQPVYFKRLIEAITSSVGAGHG